MISSVDKLNGLLESLEKRMISIEEKMVVEKRRSADPDITCCCEYTVKFCYIGTVVVVALIIGSVINHLG